MATLESLNFYLLILRPTTVFAGAVNGALSDPYMSVAVDTISVNEGPIAGQTVWFGTTAGGREYGIVRLRDTMPTGTTSGTISVAENDDVTPNVPNNAHITIKNDFRLWPIYPYAATISPTAAVLYEDRDIAWNRQTIDWAPVAVAGPPAVAFLEGGSAVVNFVGDRSYPLAPSATGTALSYVWTAEGSVEGTDANEGTTGSPVAFTWTSDGQYPVNLSLTDANSITGTNNTWSFIIDPADPENTAYIDFDAFNDSFDFDQGGGECSFVVHGPCDIDDFPEGSMVVMACRGDLVTPDSGWPFRSNILFVGYLMGNTIRQNPISGDVSFRAGTIDAVMRNTTTWPVSLTDRRGPQDWTMAFHLDADRALSFLWHYRSTLSLMAPILPCEYRPEISRQDFAPDNLHSNISDLMADAFGRVVCDHQGVLHHIVDHQKMLDTEQSAKVTQKTLDSAVWVDDVDIEEKADYEWGANVVKQSGVYYPGSEGDVLTYFSEAPGDAPKARGDEGGASSFILDTQAHLNIRCGRALGEHNQRYRMVRARFLNDGAFSIAPENPFPADIQAADNDRALTWDPTLLVRRMSREYNNSLGYIRTEVEFVPVVTGAYPGATVGLPYAPPVPELPEWDLPPPQPWPPPDEAGPAAAVDGAMGHYFTANEGVAWGRRINGLDVATQLDFSDLIYDPWWRDKTGGHNPEQAIMWGCGGGFIARSDDMGENWKDYTIYLDDPPNPWGVSPAPTVTDLTYLQIHGCIHNEDRFYAIAEWQDGGGDWHGWILDTADDGFTWEWTTIDTLPTGYVAGNNYTFEFITDGRQGWYADVDRCSDLGINPPTFEFALSPCDNGVQWFQSDFRTVGAVDWKDIIIRFPSQMTFASLSVDARRPAEGVFPERVYLNVYTSPDETTWTLLGGTFSGATPAATCQTLTVAVYATGTYVRVNTATYGNQVTPDDAVLTELTLNSLTIESGTAVPLRPLRFDVDNQDGTLLYLTLWTADDENLFIQRRATATMGLQSTTGFGPSDSTQLAAREFWVAPHCPRQPGVTDFGDNHFVHGRWERSGLNRLAYSTAGGPPYSIIDPNDWATGSASWIGAIETPVWLTVLAFLNAESPAELWRTTDHSAWSQLNAVPFDVDPGGTDLHRGDDADLIAANRDATPATGTAAATLPSPYSAAWTAADGADLPKQADGGSGLPAVVWI